MFHAFNCSNLSSYCCYLTYHTVGLIELCKSVKLLHLKNDHELAILSFALYLQTPKQRIWGKLNVRLARSGCNSAPQLSYSRFDSLAQLKAPSSLDLWPSYAAFPLHGTSSTRLDSTRLSSHFLRFHRENMVSGT